MNWREFYKLPLWFDDVTFAWTTENIMALDFDDDVTRTEALSIIERINGTSKFLSTNITYKDGQFFNDKGKYIFQIRGWGALTSPSCEGLSSEDAAKVQDDFAMYILEKINI